MLNPNFFNTIFVFPILNLLLFFNNILITLKIPGAFGFAIIALTICVRLILHPLFQKQLHTAKKMQELKPHLDRLSSQHKKDPKKLQQEQLKLYQEAGINPASGCVFLIIQIPIFIALYNTLNLFLRNGNLGKVIGAINKAVYLPALKISSIDPQFFGFNLALTPAKAGLWYYYLIPVITGFLQYYQVAVSVPKPSSDPEQSRKTSEGQGTKEEEKKQGVGEDFQKAMNTQMKYIFPILIGWFSFQFPVGLSLYWNIFSIFSIIQYKNLKGQNSNVKSNPE